MPRSTGSEPCVTIRLDEIVVDANTIEAGRRGPHEIERVREERDVIEVSPEGLPKAVCLTPPNPVRREIRYRMCDAVTVDDRPRENESESFEYRLLRAVFVLQYEEGIPTAFLTELPKQVKDVLGVSASRSLA